jgi:hypothetical protein
MKFIPYVYFMVDVSYVACEGYERGEKPYRRFDEDLN